MNVRCSKIALTLFFLLTIGYVHSQTQRIYEEIQGLKQSGLSFRKVDLFQPVLLRSFPERLAEKVSNATLMTVESSSLKGILKSQPDLIQIEVPGVGEAKGYTLELMRVEPLMDLFTIVDAKDRVVDYTPGVYYRGVIQGDPYSIAAISVFEGDIIGVVSPTTGNQVIGKWLDSDSGDSYLIYNEKDLKIAPPPACAMDAAMDAQFPHPGEILTREEASGKECKAIAVYLEADYNVFTKKGRSTASVSNYITGLYNVVSTLYANEGINTKVNKLKVWDKRDPYNYSSSNTALSSFGSSVGNTFDGDLAHLLSLSSNNLGGLAWVDVLCGRARRHAFSNIGLGYTEFPTYSWTVEVVTHEMGHNIGSPHTQRCFWGPQHNQALDNCANTEGGCPRGPAPRNGGTIMSYCHLTRYGINFRNGFGKEPGDLIRDRVRAATCLGDAFAADIAPKGPIEVYYGDSAILSASPTGAKYTYQWFANGIPIAGATAPSLVVRDNGNYNVEVSTTCSVLSKPVKVRNSEFIASINFPPTSGGRDSVHHVLRDSMKGGTSRDYTVAFKPEVFQNIPDGSNQWFVQITIHLKGGFPIYLNQLRMSVEGPAGSGISLNDFYPADGVDIFEEADTITYNLGKVDPTGNWKIHIANDNGPLVGPLYLELDFAFVWILKSTPSSRNERRCTAGTVTLDAGVRADAYQWSTGATTRSIDVATTGYYAVTATKGPLVSSDDIQVVVDPTSFEVEETICKGDSIVFGGKVLKQSGTYRESFTSSIGCDSSVTLYLTVQPDFYREEEVDLCYGEVFQGQKYFASTTVTQRLQTNAGCDSTRVYHLQVSPEITAQILVDTGCANTGSALEVQSNTPSDTYKWENGTTGARITGVKKGSISVDITNADGCTRVFQSEVPHYPAVVIDADLIPIGCAGENNGRIAINPSGGTGQIGLLWEDSSTDKVRENLGAGHYSVTATDTRQCQDERSFQMRDPQDLMLDVTVKDAVMGEANGQILLDVAGGTPPYTYLWNTGSTSKDLMNIGKGRYTVTVTDAHQCQTDTTYSVSENTAVRQTTRIPIAVRVYPNPVKHILWVEGESPYVQPMKLEVWDASGQQIIRRTYVVAKQFSLPLHTNHWPVGVYILRLTTRDQTAVFPSVVHY